MNLADTHAISYQIKMKFNCKGSDTFSYYAICLLFVFLTSKKLDLMFSHYSNFIICIISVPSGPPQNLTAICTTSTSINVKWGTVAKELQNGLILGYNVTYHKHDDEANVKYMVVNGGETLQTEITGLMKFTEYNISITAFNSKGTGNETTYANTSAITCEDGKELVIINYLSLIIIN